MGKYTVKASNVNDDKNNEKETTQTSSFEAQFDAARIHWHSTHPLTYGISDGMSWAKPGYLVNDDDIIRISQTQIPTSQVSGIDLSPTSSIKSRDSMISDKIDTPPNDNEIEKRQRELEYDDIFMKIDSLKHPCLNSAKESPIASSKIEIQQKAVYNCMSCPLYCSAKFIDEEIESFSIACQEQDGTEYVVANINEYSELFKSCPLRNKIIQIKLEK